jgi:hypothetical protein
MSKTYYRTCVPNTTGSAELSKRWSSGMALGRFQPHVPVAANQ